ncbi:MAG: DNA-3-methyladenine glycosylase 2 family protein [Clostridiales bacterium]|jgi:DNA-3-methyladenine glycosylase II|nr:DNA-3-methyladenine glycosylase 2 family protein [Clostridiales bacterium]
MQYFEYGEKELGHLRAADKRLGAAIDQIGMLRPKMKPDLFWALIESIIAQQISAKAAATVTGRLGALCAMDAGRLDALTIEEIQACGMSMRKAGYIKGASRAAALGVVDFAALARMDDQDVIRTLTALSGVGVWTAEMLLIFSLARPNVVPYGDLAVRRGMMRLYGHSDMPRKRFDRYAKRYAPYGSVASLYLWEIYANPIFE